MKKAVLVFICAALLCVLALPQSAWAGLSGGYEITAYDVKAVISADNVYDITETISVHFNDERHGIYCDIPVNDTCRVYGVSAEGNMFTAEDDGSAMSIKIGDPDTLITGDKTYKISYKMAVTDASSSYDEVYYNIIRTGWDTQISNITFSITLPNELNGADVGIYTGDKSSPNYAPKGLDYTVQGNTVNGSMQHLGMYEGLTTSIELPEGYFNKPAELPDWMGKIGLSMLLYMLFRR